MKFNKADIENNFDIIYNCLREVFDLYNLPLDLIENTVKDTRDAWGFEQYYYRHYETKLIATNIELEYRSLYCGTFNSICIEFGEYNDDYKSGICYRFTLLNRIDDQIKFRYIVDIGKYVDSNNIIKLISDVFQKKKFLTKDEMIIKDIIE